jgi:hypothetical protein
MKVIDFIKDIVRSDLNQLTIKDIGTGSNIDTVEQQFNMSRLLSFVNQGLISLYERFPLRVDTYEMDIETYDTYTEGIVESSIIKLPETAFSVVNATTDRYEDVPIDNKDIEFRFKQGAYDKIFLRTVAYNTFAVGGKNKDKVVSILFTCTAAPDLVDLDDNLPLNIKFIEALFLYVAYKGYSTVKSITPVGDESLNYLKKYKAMCEELEGTVDTIYNYSSFDPDRLFSKGFV